MVSAGRLIYASVKLRQIIPVRRDQFVNHLFDGIDVELAPRVGIEHGRLIDVLELMSAGCLNGEELHVYVCHIHGRAYDRKSSDAAGIDPAAVNKAGNLYAGLFGEVADQMAGVEDIAANLIGSAGNHGFHDVGGVLPGALVSLDTCLKKFCIFLLPGLDLVNAAARIFVQRDVVAVYEFRISALYIKAVVLCVVFTGLSTIVAEITDIVKTDLIFKFGIRYFGSDTGLDLGIEVIAVLVRRSLEQTCTLWQSPTVLTPV